MALKQLEVLQKELKILTDHVKTKKEELQAQLAKKEPISAQDKQWLDHDANLVDEQQVLEVLESALDYEQGLEGLDDEQRGLVKKLCEAAVANTLMIQLHTSWRKFWPCLQLRYG